MEAQEFKGQFKYLGEITKKWITFSAPIEKEIKVYEKTSGDIIDEKITYKLKLADSAKFIPTHYQILQIIFLKEFIKLM